MINPEFGKSFITARVEHGHNNNKAKLQNNCETVVIENFLEVDKSQ